VPILIVLAGVAGTILNPTDVAELAAYLESYDPEYAGGLGDCAWTADRAKAKRFPDMAAALEEWRRQPVSRPTRADGKPNRPLTAFSVTFETVDS
jgi:hypothetical protein